MHISPTISQEIIPSSFSRLKELIEVDWSDFIEYIP
jgi:hypothetical protein